MFIDYIIAHERILPTEGSRGVAQFTIHLIPTSAMLKAARLLGGSRQLSAQRRSRMGQDLRASGCDAAGAT